MRPKSKSKPRGKPFENGDPRAGRPKGTPNRATTEAKEVCSALVDDPEYLEALRTRLLSGTLAPGVEALLWHYAKGKPREIVEHQAASVGQITFFRLPANGRERPGTVIEDGPAEG